MVCFAETLEMHHLPLAQEFDDVVYIRIVAQTKDIVVGHASLLLCRQVLGQICNQIAFAGHTGRAVGETGGGGGIYAGSSVYEIGVKTCRLDLFVRQIARQLVDNRSDHLQMPQLFGPDVCQQSLQFRVGHGKTLAEVAQGCAQLAVRSPVLQ